MKSRQAEGGWDVHITLLSLFWHSASQFHIMATVAFQAISYAYSRHGHSTQRGSLPHGVVEHNNVWLVYVTKLWDRLFFTNYCLEFFSTEIENEMTQITD